MNPMQGQQSTGGSSTDLNQGDNEPVYSAQSSLNTMMNPVDNGPTYESPSSHNWWRLGESSSVSGPSDIKTNQQLQHGGVHAAGYNMRNGPAFLRGSSSNAANMSMDMDSSDDDYGARPSGLVFRHSSYGSSLGSSVQATGESSSGPAASSLDGWGSSCKRKALEAAIAASAAPPSPTLPDCSGLSHYGASSSLSLATPSQTSQNRTEHMFGSGGGGGRAVATNAFHSDTSSRPGRRLNLRHPQESVGFSLSHHSGGSMQQSLPLNSPSADPQVHLPALTRNIPQFAWDTSLSSRASTSSGIGMPAELFGPPRSNPEQPPMFAPPVHDQSIWSFTRGNPPSTIDAQQLSPAWIPPPQSAPPPRASELSPWSLFPSVESQSTTSHGPAASLPILPSVSSNEAATAMPSSSSNSHSHRARQRRSGLLSERQSELLHLRHLGRSLAADSDGRNHLISEVCLL